MQTITHLLRKISGIIFESAILYLLECGWGECNGPQHRGQISWGSGRGIRVSERTGEKQSWLFGSLRLL